MKPIVVLSPYFGDVFCYTENNAHMVLQGVLQILKARLDFVHSHTLCLHAERIQRPKVTPNYPCRLVFMHLYNTLLFCFYFLKYFTYF